MHVIKGQVTFKICKCEWNQKTKSVSQMTQSLYSVVVFCSKDNLCHSICLASNVFTYLNFDSKPQSVEQLLNVTLKPMFMQLFF